jgi:hypothetical protein
MTVADFCLVQGKSIVRGTLGMLLGMPQLLRLKGSPLYWKALHHCLLCMSSYLPLDLLLHMLRTLFLVQHVLSSQLLFTKFNQTWLCDGVKISGCAVMPYFPVGNEALRYLTIYLFFPCSLSQLAWD